VLRTVAVPSGTAVRMTTASERGEGFHLTPKSAVTVLSAVTVTVTRSERFSHPIG